MVSHAFAITNPERYRMPVIIYPWYVSAKALLELASVPGTLVPHLGSFARHDTYRRGDVRFV